MSDAVSVLASMTIEPQGHSQRLLTPFRYDKVETNMICNHKLLALLTINRESVVTPQYFGVSTQPATRIADYAPSTTLPIHNALNERGVVELAGGDSEVSSTRTRSLAEKGARLGLFALTLSTLAGCAQPSRAPVTPPPTPPQSNFVVFDGTLYQAKPSLEQFGLKPITVLYQASMWPAKSSDPQSVPDADVVRSLALKASQSTGIAVVDIEQWQLVGDPATAAQSLDKYQQTLQMFQQVAPSLQVGYYSVAPIRDYWSPIDGPQSPNYVAWQQQNDTVAPIAKQANALFPSAYTFYTDQAGWQTYAIAQIAEARRIGQGRPVYVFLWPQYDNGKGAQGGDYLADDYWKMELETARKYADGVVIWGGWKQTWDSNASWWLETQQFITETGASQAGKTGK
jgi:Hyaluronidase